jgi:hypothetical protein
MPNRDEFLVEGGAKGKAVRIDVTHFPTLTP